MHLLVLGGTHFVGLHIVEAALRAGHTVDVFTRGRSPAPTGARLLVGDRNGDLSALDTALDVASPGAPGRGRASGDDTTHVAGGGTRVDRWDAVVDVSGYLPRQVRATAERLSGRAGRYLFISTGSVYRDWDEPNTVEDAPLHELDDPTTEAITAETYGALKVACERVAQEAFDGQVLSIRPTFVVGPHDHTDRFTSWLRRVRDNPRVAVPVAPDVPLAFIDARDLAAFVLRLAESDAIGAVNASGPAEVLTWGSVLALAREVTGSRAELEWLPASFLEGRELQGDPFPMAIPFPFRGAPKFSLARAQELGLTLRSVSDTIRDTLAWDDAAGVPRAGITAGEEEALLRAWDESRGRG